MNDDIDLDGLASIADDRKELRDPGGRRRRGAELVKVAAGLVVAGRITIVEAARLTGTSRQRIHQALPPHHSRKPFEEERAAYVDRLWSRLVAAHDREEACWRADQAKADAEWDADLAALDDDEVEDKEAANVRAFDEQVEAIGRRPAAPVMLPDGRRRAQLGAVAAFLKLQARRGGDLDPETIAAAMDGSGYSVALIAELLVALHASGDDRILAEAAAAGPAD